MVDKTMNRFSLFVCSIWCVLLVSTSFLSGNDLANGLIMGRVFWFHGVILLGCVCLLLFIRSESFPGFTWLDILPLLYFSSIIIPYDWVLNPEPEKLWFAGQIVVLWYMSRFFLSRFPVLRLFLMALWIGAGILQAIYGVRQLYGFGYSNHALFNLTGTFFNPGPYSGYLAVLLPLALHATFSKIRIVKLYAWIAVSLILSILPAGMSRSAWLAAAMGCGYVLVAHEHARFSVSWMKSKWRYVCFAFVLIALFFGSMEFYQLKKDSADGRLLMWKVSSQIIMDRQGVGVGLGGFPAAYASKQADYLQYASKQERWIAGCPEYAFNEYLQIGVEQGIFCLVLFLVWMFGIIWKGSIQQRYGCTGGIIALAFFAFSSYPFQLPDFWILYILLAVLSIDEPEGKQEEKHVWKFHLNRFCLVSCAGVGFLFFSLERPYYKAYQSWNRIKTLYQNRAYEMVVDDYQNLYENLCHKPEFLFEAAQCLGKTGNEELAISYLSRANRLSSDPMILYIWAKNEQSIGNPSKAEMLLLQGIKVLPERIYPYYLLAYLYADPAFCDLQKMNAAIDSVLIKSPKVINSAIREMRQDVKRLRDRAILNLNSATHCEERKK